VVGRVLARVGAWLAALGRQVEVVHPDPWRPAARPRLLPHHSCHTKKTSPKLADVIM